MTDTSDTMQSIIGNLAFEEATAIAWTNMYEDYKRIAAALSKTKQTNIFSGNFAA